MSVIDKDNLLYDDTNSFWVVRTCVVTGIGKFIGDFIVLDIVESSVIPVVVKSFSVVVVVLEILGTANKRQYKVNGVKKKYKWFLNNMDICDYWYNQ